MLIILYAYKRKWDNYKGKINYTEFIEINDKRIVKLTENLYGPEKIYRMFNKNPTTRVHPNKDAR